MFSWGAKLRAKSEAAVEFNAAYSTALRSLRKIARGTVIERVLDVSWHGLCVEDDGPPKAGARPVWPVRQLGLG